MARLEQAITHTISQRRDPDEQHLLHRYAIWHMLRRLRSRNNGAETTSNQFTVLMRHLRGALGLLDWLTTRRGHARLGDQGTSRWLFPGGEPGRPVSSYQLTERLRHLGIRPGQSRSTALFQLATELPAALLARMLGIHISVAVAWQRASAGDWTNYAADLSRRTSPRPAPPS